MRTGSQTGTHSSCGFSGTANWALELDSSTANDPFPPPDFWSDSPFTTPFGVLDSPDPPLATDMQGSVARDSNVVVKEVGQ